MTELRCCTVMIEETVAVEVVFALPEKQEVIQLEVPSGTLIRDAIRLSYIELLFPGYDLSGLPIGVWNEVKTEAYVVQSGDRVQIYRSLVRSAKDTRRRRAETHESKDA